MKNNNQKIKRTRIQSLHTNTSNQNNSILNNTNLNNSINQQSNYVSTKQKFISSMPKRNPNYSFSEGPSFLDETIVQEKARTKLPRFKPSTSLAEENLVKDFNKFTKLDQIQLPTNQPQRIELPLFFNTPNRTQHFRSKSFQNVQGKQTSAEYIRAQRRLKDYNMLGFACRRAGKTRDEGRTYYSQGVLCDNMGKFKDAILHYKKFLQVCKTIGDQHGEALAYNCIGVDYQILGENDEPKLIQEAILYHKHHLELADVNGKFLALINLGLCYDKLGMYEESMIQYQNALRHSIKMANLVGQTIAIGNIGKIGTNGLHTNKEKMKIFVEKYMKLSNELRDTNGELNAHLKLGELDIQNKNFEQGKNQFEKALEIAQKNGDQTSFSYSKCGYAISNVENHIQDYLQDYKQNNIAQISTNKIENYQY